MPKAKDNEFFGLWGICGKSAAVMGTFVVGFLTVLTGNSSIVVVSVAVLFVVGLVLLIRMPETADASGQ